MLAKEVITLRDRSYRNEAVAPDYSYQAGRGSQHSRLYPVDEKAAEGKPIITKVWASYDVALPSMDDLSVDKVIEERLNNNRGPVRILDIGCGAGVFLLGKKRDFGENVECVGITARPFAEQYYMDREKRLTYADASVKTKVKIVVGDAQRLQKTLLASDDNEPFDVVVAQGSLHYMADPLSVVKQVYRILREPSEERSGGIFFGGLDGHSSYEALESIQSILIDKGYDFHLIPKTYKQKVGVYDKQSSGGIIITRNFHRNLHLPLRYSSTTVENTVTVGVNTEALTYVAET